jgi:hypothetical protein
MALRSTWLTRSSVGGSGATNTGVGGGTGAAGTATGSEGSAGGAAGGTVTTFEASTCTFQGDAITVASAMRPPHSPQ